MPLLNKEEMPLELHNWISVVVTDYDFTSSLCPTDRTRVEDEIIAHYYDSYWEAANAGLSDEDSHAAAMQSLGSELEARRSILRENITEKEKEIFEKLKRIHGKRELVWQDSFWGFGTLYLFSSCYSTTIISALCDNHLSRFEIGMLAFFFLLMLGHYSCRTSLSFPLFIVLRGGLNCFSCLFSAFFILLEDGIFYSWTGINYATMMGFPGDYARSGHLFEGNFIYIIFILVMIFNALFELRRTRRLFNKISIQDKRNRVARGN